MGVISEVVACFSRNPLFGYKIIAYSSLGIAFVGFLAWGHHMFVSGQSIFDRRCFRASSRCWSAIFSAIKIFNWVATMYKGSIDLKTPMLYVFGFLFLFVFGGMTGVGHRRPCRSTFPGTAPTSSSATSTSSWWARR